MYKRILVMLLAALISSAALADNTIYKWVDKNGQVHYSTVPKSPNAQALNIVNTANNFAPPAGSVPAATSSTAEANQALTTITPNDSTACKSARENLGKYLDASYLYTLGKNGQKQKLSAEQQNQAITQAKSAVVQACPPGGS